MVPEVGSETMRTAAHLIGARPRRHRPVPLLHDLPEPAAAVREHDARADRAAGGGARAEHARSVAEVERFIGEFTARGDADPRRTGRRGSPVARCATSGATSRSGRSGDRDNEYLRPSRFVANYVARAGARRWSARSLYSELDRRAASSSTSPCTSPTTTRSSASSRTASTRRRSSSRSPRRFRTATTWC